jgi:hypothetical protein
MNFMGGAAHGTVMKTCRLYPLILFLLLGFNALADDRVVKQGELASSIEMSISLKANETKIAIDNSVVLRIVLKNLTTNQTFSIYSSLREETEEALSFVVTTPSGTNKIILTGPPHSGAIILIPPGETREIEFNLSRLCGFQEIGDYKVVAKYRNLWGTPYFEAISNPLEVSVVKASGASEPPKTNNSVDWWFP